MIDTIHIEKAGSATSLTKLSKLVMYSPDEREANVGDVVVVRALSESVSYGNIELPTGRLAKINTGDILLCVLGKRRALKGFFGDVPKMVAKGARLHLLNMGGVIGECTGHHSSLSDAIQLEVVGTVVNEDLSVVNTAQNALRPTNILNASATIILVGGSCMNSGKTVAAVELIRQASNNGLRVAAAKLSGVACLRDTLNMEDHGAFVTASFLNCGLPSTVDCDISGSSKAILNYLNSYKPDLIVVELGDGIVGGYGVDSVLADDDIREHTSSFVFCASDYVGVIGGAAVLKEYGIDIDVIAGSVTDSEMGERFVTEHLGLKAGNARRNGAAFFELVTGFVVEKGARA